ncbi:hypothetical protein [Corynebacterium heidelbergense]|uniref:Uncharacterized protein n=1 Tax=Corynebacterium heidelbergense TaxID=2055947 RepID=A0A364V5K9_9CORY|nr:hypothetical protein [Corynebacterium heidelbergense]RAV31923.1 hypothetical protein DLJ54_05900 [Corynebacterium heidelbergense]
MKRANTTTAAAAVIAGALLLGGCGSQEASNGGAKPATTAAPAAVTAPPQGGQPSADQDRMEAYRKQIAAAASVTFDGPNYRIYPELMTGEYQYALIDLGGDGQKDLLLKRVSREVSPIRAFTYDPASRTAKMIGDPAGDGAASAGGERAAVAAAVPDGGMLVSDGRSGTGLYTTTLWKRQGFDLQKTSRVWNYRSDQKPGDLQTMEQPIKWYAAGDEQGLTSSPTQEPAPAGAPQPTFSQSGEQPQSQGPSTSSGRSKADYPSFTAGRTGTAWDPKANHTSKEFARAVYNQFIEAWIRDGNASPQLSVQSPVTGQTYQMSCKGNQHGALCTGGNDAKVYIYAPFPEDVTMPYDMQWG